jgi:uncharacterized membrane protein
MYSKAKLFGKPIHPMLVAFPVAFYVATLFSYVVYNATGNIFWFQVGYIANIAGVVMAAAAAIPGFIDWYAGIPKKHPAKKTGFAHMTFNVLALLVFAANIVMQSGKLGTVAPNADFAVLLSAIGVVLTGIAGYLGSTLVQKHHVGVELTPQQVRFEPFESRHDLPSHPAL